MICYYGASDQPGGDAGRELLGHRGSELGVCTQYYFNTKTGVVTLTNGDCDQVAGYERVVDAINNRLFDTFESLLGVKGATVSANESIGAVARGRGRSPPADLCDF